MSKSILEDLDAVASWFYGPGAENEKYIGTFYDFTVQNQINARKYYQNKWNDPSFFGTENQQSEVFQKNMETLTRELTILFNGLADETVPFWSPRYMGHMVMEPTLASNLGYVAALQYNQNNVAIEASPLTTFIEMKAGKQLCKMLGFTVSDDDEGKDEDDSAWGHITCDGSVANLESFWAARNLKFYPLSLRLAIDEGELTFIGSSFEVELANQERKLLKYCTTWELLNLKPTTVLEIPNRLNREYGISPQFLETALYKYNIQTVGKDFLEQKFGITNSPLYFVSATKHYSFPKGCAIAGIGSGNLKNLPVDNKARVDINELNKILRKCVQDKQAIYAVAAVMGSTDHGAIDPLADIVALRDRYQRKYGLSFIIHGDGAWGGYFCSILVEPEKGLKRRKGFEERKDEFVPKLALNPYTEKQLRSLKDCDSVTVDPHKSGYIPYPAGSLCYRDQRMRYLVTWKAPEVYRHNEESIGIYGVEGSKPGAAPISVWLSNKTIGLHQRGYGTLLGRAIFTSCLMYCHFATMSNEDDDFIVTPLIQQKEEVLEKIRNLIIGRNIEEIINDDNALQLLKEVGPDLMIITFACNFKVNGKLNKDIFEANYLNQRLFESFSITDRSKSNKDVPFIITSTVFEQKEYGDCLKNFKARLGLEGDQDLRVLVSVIMTPWPIENNFTAELAEIFKKELKELVEQSIQRNKDKEVIHTFVMQGTDEIYLTHRPMQDEAQRHQVIIKVKLDKEDEYKKLRKEDRSRVLILQSEKLLISDWNVCNNEQTFNASIHIIHNGEELEKIPDVIVTIIKLLKKRHLRTPYQDADYPIDHVPFYLYGTDQLHIDHMHLKYPFFQLSAENIHLELSDNYILTERQRENGVIVHITDFHEIAIQPFQVKIEDFRKSFFFKDEYEVELYEDPASDPTQNGPGLDNVAIPFAEGKMRFPSCEEGSLFIDSIVINKINPDTELFKPGKPVSWTDYYKKLLDTNSNNWYEKND